MQEAIFEEKYNLYKETIYNLCYAYLKNAFEAEDAFQEIFLKFYYLKKTFLSLDHEKHYLIRMAINYLKDVLRKRKRKEGVIREVGSILVIEKEVYKENISVLELISPLKDIYKDVIILKYVEDMDNASIAKTLNISEANVRKRLQRALSQLKEGEET